MRKLSVILLEVLPPFLGAGSSFLFFSDQEKCVHPKEEEAREGGKEEKETERKEENPCER